jgi:hypothetical protein
MKGGGGEKMQSKFTKLTDFFFILMLDEFSDTILINYDINTMKVTAYEEFVDL